MPSSPSATSIASAAIFPDSLGETLSPEPARTGPSCSADFRSRRSPREATCALTAVGQPYCWGDNQRGAVGDGTTTSRSVPVAVTGGLIFAEIFGGFDRFCGLTAAGMRTAGEKRNWLSGDRYHWQRDLAAARDGGLRFSTLSIGSEHACGLIADGSAYCWGVNTRGQLGDNTSNTHLTPTAVVTAAKFSQIAAGGEHTCASISGNAFCWGRNAYGELGDRSSRPSG